MLDERYPDKEEFKQKVAEYFSNCDIADPKVPYTIPGLSESLKCLPEDIIFYPRENQLSQILRFASLKCENYLITNLINGTISKSVGEVLLKLYFPQKKEDKKEESIGDILTSLESNRS
jgi:hypothetical protein